MIPPILGSVETVLASPLGANVKRSESSVYTEVLTRLLSPAEQAVLRLVNPFRMTGSVPEGPNAPVAYWKSIALILSELRLGPRLALLEQASGESSELPPELRATLHAARAQAAAWNAFLFSEQAELLERLAKKGIECFPVKGISLGNLLHGEIGGRFTTDIDLAIRPADLASAAEVLTEAGFHIPLPLRLLRHDAFLRGTTFKTSELSCVREDMRGRLLVELHWRLYPGEPREGWPLHNNGAGATLSPASYFYYLCTHLAARGWTDLAKLCDLGDFLLKFGGAIDGVEFWQMAARSGHRRNVAICLELLAMLFALRWQFSQSDWRIQEAAREVVRRPFLRRPPGDALDYHRERRRNLDSATHRVQYLRWLARPAAEDWVDASGGLRSAASARARRWMRLAGIARAPHGKATGQASA